MLKYEKVFIRFICLCISNKFSAFTLKEVEAPRQSVRYAVYNTIGSMGEKVFSNYTLQSTIPPATMCPEAIFVCWFRLTDVNADGLIDQIDFSATVNALDTDSDGLISDNQLENGVSYEETVH